MARGNEQAVEGERADVEIKVEPLFYDTNDIQVIMSCKGDEARAIARMFLAKGQARRKGRNYQVPRVIFDDWVRQECGLDQYYKVPLKVIEGGRRAERARQ